MESRAGEIAAAICMRTLTKPKTNVTNDTYVAFTESIIEEIEPLIVELEAVRTQLSDMQTGARALVGAIDFLPRPSGSHYGDPRYSCMVTSDVIKRCRDAANLLRQITSK